VVVKGDGSLISEHKAKERPIETILSGPAASIIGAVTLTGVQDAVVMDMGGTTLDLAVLRKGSPAINRSGAQVGGWFTRVQAAAITTAGLGGDSLIDVDNRGNLSIGPRRVYPLSGIVARFPYLQDELREIKESEYTLFNTLPTMVLIHQKDPANAGLTAGEKEILDMIREGPHTLYQISKQLNRYYDLLPWQGLARTGAVLPSSVTPTDILHLTGAYEPWDREAARLGVKILAYRFGSGIEPFIDIVMEEIYLKIVALAAGRLIGEEEGFMLDYGEQIGRFFLKEMLRRDKVTRAMAISARLNLPLVAVGAPVGAYFPEVAERLKAKLLIPPNAGVANAVGTVSGQTLERITVLIKPDGEKGFIVHAPWGRELSVDFEETASRAVQKGKEYAAAKAAASGALDVAVFVDRRDSFARIRGYGGGDGEDGDNKIFIESKIEVSAIGRPWS
jgi:N-methylhydantoinase A/oxoprolinase/acetone carboxylase beta subunit